MDGQFNRHVCIEAALVTLDGEEIHFPVGWITDFASVPWYAQSILPQIGPHGPAALIHDRLLDLDWERDLARFWLQEQLKELDDVHPARKFVMPKGVWLWDLFKYKLKRKKKQ